MKYLCMFVAFKIKTNKSEKGEIRKNLTIMKTGKTELPRSTSGADEFFILQGKKQGVRIEGEGYVIREFSYSDCESLAENADNNKIWNNLMDNFPHPYTKREAMDQECRIYSGSCVTKSCYQKRTADRFLLFQ